MSTTSLYCKACRKDMPHQQGGIGEQICECCGHWDVVGGNEIELCKTCNIEDNTSECSPHVPNQHARAWLRQCAKEFPNGSEFRRYFEYVANAAARAERSGRWPSAPLPEGVKEVKSTNEEPTIDPELYKVATTYAQEGNTLGTTDDSEFIEINLEFQLGESDKDGAFIVIKSDTGWSFNKISDLTDLIERTQRILKG